MPVRHRPDFKQTLSTLRQLKDRRCSSSAKMVAKLFLVLVELARILVAFFLWASPRKRTQHWLISETCWKVIGPLIRGMILRINLVQYSSKFGNSQQQFTVTDGEEGVNTIPPIQQNPTSKRLRWNKGYGESYENMCATNYSIITNNKWNDAYNKQLTKHDTTNDVDTMQLHFNGRVAYMHWVARTAHLPQFMMTPHTSWLKFCAHFISSSLVINMAHSPWLVSPLSTSTSFSCLFPSSSSTSSCSLSSTTRSSWQTCAAPLQKRVRTPERLHLSHRTGKRFGIQLSKKYSWGDASCLRTDASRRPYERQTYAVPRYRQDQLSPTQ